MPSHPNRREFTRVPVQLEANVTAQQASSTCRQKSIGGSSTASPIASAESTDEQLAVRRTSVQGQSRNVSLSGVFLHCDTLLPVGTSCCVTLRLADRYDKMGIAASGRVVRLQDEGMAIMFTEILGFDSFTHLRNLVLSNSFGVTEQVEQEFRTHVGIKRLVGYQASVAY